MSLEAELGDVMEASGGRGYAKCGAALQPMLRLFTVDFGFARGDSEARRNSSFRI